MLKSSSHHERPETAGGIGNNHNGDRNDSSSSYFDDEVNESDGMMSQVASNNNDDIEAKEVNRSLAKAETKYVHVLRVVVLALMVGAAVAVAVIIYTYMKDAQETDLADDFFYLSNRLVGGFHANTRMRFQVLDSFSLQVTVMAMATGQTWPFVTLDNFEAIGTAARSIVDSYYMALYPYVTEEKRQAWENYTAQNTYWLDESFTYQRDFFDIHKHTVGMKAPALERRRKLNTGRALQEEQAIQAATFDGPNNISTDIYRYPNDDEEGVDFVVDELIGPYIPIWQVSPARAAANIDVNYNMYDPSYSFSYASAFEEIMKTDTGIFGAVWNVDEEGMVWEDDDYDYRPVPAASLFYPVFETVLGGANRSAVAALEMDVEFGALFSSVLPPNSDSLICVIKNTCGQTFSFEVSGELAIYLGPQDQHDPNFDHMVLESLLTDFDKVEDQNYNGVRINKNFCPWVLSVYGTQDMYDAHINNEPVMYLCAVLGIFLFTCFVFVMYDCLVEYRQRKVQKTAENSEKIVASLFPKAFRDQLYNENENKAKAAAKKQGPTSYQTSEVSRFFGDEQAPGGPNFEGMGSLLNSPPMAELYPNCTVFFADIAGFTAWSSSRTPADVFTLLETLYGHFDKFARKHKVFKIETIGDCYVAVTGLPVAQPNHAVLMVKFARDCLAGMGKYTVKLEGTLGPDTGGLALRVGLHSGPVTAGVLRGEKARFQLFGDTVNTTARMESNGQPGCIHVSQDTANILIAMGKKHWVEARPEKVYCKGKGDLQTYFVSVNTPAKSNSTPASDTSTHDDEDMFDVEVAVAELDGGEAEDKRQEWVEKNYKRIGWVRDLLQDQLEIIVGQRGSRASEPQVWDNVTCVSSTRFSWNGDMGKSLLSASDNVPMDISGDLSREILELVSQVAYSLPRVPYHNFDQTCCVLMSLDRMFNQGSTDVESELKPSPLAKFACFFAALIRNLSSPVAPDVVRRQGDGFVLLHQSAAESKSADVALELLKSDRFSGLREALCPNVSEFQSFWGIVQNLILATDASGGTLTEERDKRWDLSFGSDDHTPAQHEKVISFLEHILLVAEEGYAAQHWDNYVKWSNLLLDEYRDMYQRGELHQDPDTFWHQSRLNYFDSFVLPLAQKIDSAGVLGTMGHEFYNYASQNRRELDSAEGMATMKESSHGSRPMQDSSSQRRRWSRPVSTSKNTPKKNKPKSAQRRRAPQVPQAAPASKTPASQPGPFASNVDETDFEHILEV